MPRFLTLLFCALAGPSIGFGNEIDFNRDIRPILSENCFYCHGQDGNKREADLRLDDRKAAIEHGAFDLDDPGASLLLERILTDDPDDIMPPANSNRQLTAAQQLLIKRWIEKGAPYQDHWAFVTPKRPETPTVSNPAWTKNPIDRFVLAKLEAEGVQPSPEADKHTLIKRLYGDLLGLPPTREEIDAFVSDASPDAWEKSIDRVLQSEHYGERMALAWLDAARYADSNGFQQDGDTWQWIWRDWLVKALNDDLPFDQFTIQSLAGDLLPEATTEQKIASGFNRNHLLNGEGGAINEEQRFVNLFDRVDTTSTTWLGLTVACAQCHDHKYDPITMHDYYAMLDMFNRVPEVGRPQRLSTRIRVDRPYLHLPTEENKKHMAKLEAKIAEAVEKEKPVLDAKFAEWEKTANAENKDLPGNLKAIISKVEGERTDAEKKALETGLRNHFNSKIRPQLKDKTPEIAAVDNARKALNDYKNDKTPHVMVMSDAQPRKTSILDRGAYLSPLEEVKFATPAFLPAMKEDAPQNRLGFAQWLVDPEHPLTARVQVNRIWQHFFGLGIVRTSEDFGVQSEYPIHMDLLDWLAVEFRESGWSVKKMQKLMLMSATYRQSSRMEDWHREQDRENRLYARASRFRMPSMILRDWALASSDLLGREIGGKPVYPYQPDNVWEALAITKERDFTYPASDGDNLYRRSIYTFWRRTVSPTNMFDASDRQACRVKQSLNNTPLHALTTLNDPTWIEAARVLAQNTLTKHEDLDAQLDEIAARVLCRPLSDLDRERLRAAHAKQLTIYQADPSAAAELLKVGAKPRDEKLDAPQHAALTAIALGVLNLDEALTRQ
ncbi:MAG: PSD1 and planctomycete cytochrome C domain-containing protein [Verrucomicrobiota bacterium]